MRSEKEDRELRLSALQIKSMTSLNALPYLNFAHIMGCAVRFAGRYTPIAKGASGYARQPALRAACQWLPRCLAVWLLGYCSAVHRPYPGRSDQTGALPVIFRYVTLLNVAPKAGCRASFASSLSRRAGQAPHQLTVLGHLNGWGRFTPAAPPSLSAIKLGL